VGRAIIGVLRLRQHLRQLPDYLVNSYANANRRTDLSSDTKLNSRLEQLPIEQVGFPEPENPNRVNLVRNGFEGGLFVFSDRPLSPLFINFDVFQQFSDRATVGGVGFDTAMTWASRSPSTITRKPTKLSQTQAPHRVCSPPVYSLCFASGDELWFERVELGAAVSRSTDLKLPRCVHCTVHDHFGIAQRKV